MMVQKKKKLAGNLKYTLCTVLDIKRRTEKKRRFYNHRDHNDYDIDQMTNIVTAAIRAATKGNKLTISSWNAHSLFYRLNNERHSKLKDPDIIKYLNSDIVGIVEMKACETDSISLQGYSLLSKTNRPRLSKGIYGGVAVSCKVGISKGIIPLPVTHSEYI